MNIILKFVFLTLLMCSSMLSISSAYADLLVSPVRASFGDRERSTVVNVMNRSNQERTYRIEWMELKMKPEGGYDRYEKREGETTASDLVKFSPRQVTLAPGESQSVRLALRRPADLASGEYTSHLLFRQLPNAANRKDTNPVENAHLKLNVNTSLSIPVIVRVGQIDVGAKFVSAKFTQKSDSGEVIKGFDIEIERTSMHSPYGSVMFFDINDTERRYPIATVNNFSIFPEIKTRKIFVPILEKVQTIPKELIAVYIGQGEFKGQNFDEMRTNTQ